MVNKHKFIVKDDPWGIRKLMRDVFKKHSPFTIDSLTVSEKILFDVFFNQFVPPAWRETRKTILRHLTEIKNLLSDPKRYSPMWVWIKRNGQFKCGLWNHEVARMVKNKEVELPTYLEIEEEKMRWQREPNYNKEEGFSQPLEEEVIQIKICKRR